MTRFGSFLRRLAAAALALAAVSVPVAAPAWAQLAYDVTVAGLEDEALRELIEGESLLLAGRARPPASLLGLERRARADVERIDAILRSRGYYAGEVDVAIEREAEPVRVVLTVAVGPRFRLRDYRVISRGPDAGPPPPEIGMEALGLEAGQPAEADLIVAAEDRLLVVLARRGYPLATLQDRRVVADFASETVSVELTVDTGPFARFGAVRFEGLEGVEEDFARRRIPWAPGDRFDLRRLEEARQRLLDTRLFSSVRLIPAEALDAEGRLPVTAQVTERPPRSVGGTLDYDTSRGPGVTLFWEHRNLAGDGETVRPEAYYRPTLYGAGVEGRLRDLGEVDQDLIASASASREDAEGFAVTSVAAAAMLQRPLGRHWQFAGGVRLERELTREGGTTSDFNLLSFPLRAARDSTDDPLDPSRGGRLVVQAEPFLGVFGTGIDFTRVEVSDAQYTSLDEERRYVLAGWGRVGSVIDADSDAIPADKRFYAGGGGSIRGFGYQLAGPVDGAGDPVGGRSLLAAGLELRGRFTDTIGAAAFVEAGSVYPDRIPDLSERLFVGAGLGARYFSPIGPVRVDLAVPLNPRRDVDDAFQFYISVGQAF